MWALHPGLQGEAGTWGKAPDHLPLSASPCQQEREDGASWLLAARFQTAEWKTAVQEIKTFISVHEIGIQYSKDSLDCMSVFNSEMMDAVLLWS